MSSTYNVGVEVNIKSNVVQALEAMGRELAKFDRQIVETVERVETLATALKTLGSANRSIKSLAENLEKLKAAANGDQSVASNMEKASAAIRSATTNARELTVALRENARLSGQMATNANRTREAEAGAARRASRGHGGGATDAGMAGLLIGAPIVTGTLNALRQGMDTDHMRTVLVAQGVEPGRIDELQNHAMKATQTAPGTTINQNLGALMDLRQVLGSTDEAVTALPEMAKLQSMLQLFDRRHGGSGDEVFAAAKAEEILGGLTSERTVNGKTEQYIDPAQLHRKIEEISRVTVATNGRVDPTEYLKFAKQARIGGMLANDTFLYEQLPAMMMVLGGSRTGTALNSLNQLLDGKKMTATSMVRMHDAGLASLGGVTYERDRITGKKKEVVHPEAIYDEELLRHNPLEWMAKAKERMEAKGIHGAEAQEKAMQGIWQRGTVAGVMADLLKDMAAIFKEQQNIKQVIPGAPDYLTQNDPTAKLQQMQAAFSNLMTTLGQSMMGDAVNLMDMVTKALNGLTAWAQAHPKAATDITELGAAMGAIAAAAGTAMLTIGPAVLVAKSLMAGKPPVPPGPGAAPLAAAEGGFLSFVLGKVVAPIALAFSARENAKMTGGIIDDVDDIIHGKLPRSLADRVGAAKGAGAGATPESVAVQESARQLNQAADSLKAVKPPPPVQQTVQVQSTIDLDGQRVGEIMTRHIVRELDRVPGAHGWDPGLGPIHHGDIP